MGFHVAIGSTRIPGGAAGARVIAGVCLLLAFMVPVVGLVSAIQLSKIETPTKAELWARRIALLAVGSPAIFTMVGVVFYMVGIGQADTWVLGVIWTGLTGLIAFSDRRTPVALPPKSSRPTLQKTHGMVALGIIVVFLIMHIINHLFGLIGPEAHTTIMKALRHIYQTPVIEPILMVGFFSQIITGSYLGWRYTRGVADGFRTFQLVSGTYLIFSFSATAMQFLSSHGASSKLIRIGPLLPGLRLA
jgi:hypothetical protein